MRAKIGMVLAVVVALAVCAGGGCKNCGENSAPPGMVSVPAGEFTMGVSADEGFKECKKFYGDKCKRKGFTAEEQVHKVYLDAFYIDKTEVTQEDYDTCVAAGKCKANEKYNGFTGAKQPVVGVDWEDAKTYCEWAGKRLPTEAEWEKAARGTDGRMYPWGNEEPSCEHAVFNPTKRAGCGRGKTWEVGSKPKGASPYGALDMAGNVWEWIADWYDADYYENSPAKNPKGPDTGTLRVLRGGYWSSYPYNLRVVHRYYYGPSYRFNLIGFRCSRD